MSKLSNRPLQQSIDSVSDSGSVACLGRDLIVAAVLYLSAASVLLGRGLFGCAGCYIGRETDPPAFMWFFRWWQYAFTHRLNPFWTDLVWSPRGFNLAWATIVPLPAWVSIPLQGMFGVRIAYNIICIAALAAAAASAYALCRRLTHSFWPSIAGGALFGFSPYMLGQVLGHLNQIAVFPVPLAVLATLKHLDGEISPRRYVATITVLLIFQFLCTIEIFATLTVAAGIAIIVTLACLSGDERAKVARSIPLMSLAYLAAAVALSPYLYELIAHGIPHAPIWTPDRYAADVVNFVVPTEINWLGTMKTPRALAGHFRGTLMENGAYLGLAVMLILEAFRRRTWSTPAGKLLTLTLVALVLFAIGPTMHVAGRLTFPMPGAIIGRLPLISSALPVRFMMYAFLAAALMIALWLASPGRRWIRYAAAAALVVSLFPNPDASFWVSRLEVPAFFTTGRYRVSLAPHEIVVALPFGQRGNSMYWQACTGMYFRMAGGWTGIIPFEFERMPALNLFYGANDLPEAADQIRAYLAQFDVRAVLADPHDFRLAGWKPALDSLGLASVEDGGLTIYHVPPGAFAAYRTLSGAYLEQRAMTLRFDTILTAVALYLESGHDPAKISAATLKQFNLLPRDWTVDLLPDAVNDWSVSRIANDEIAIAMRGSYAAASPLIERYYSIARQVLYPAPARWTPSSQPDPEVIGSLLITFDRAGILNAARRLKTSPPIEMTTPFVEPARATLPSVPGRAPKS